MGSDSSPKHLNIRFTRAQLESLVGDLVEKTFEPVKKALSDAGMSTKDIQEVVMVAV